MNQGIMKQYNALLSQESIALSWLSHTDLDKIGPTLSQFSAYAIHHGVLTTSGQFSKNTTDS